MHRNQAVYWIAPVATVVLLSVVFVLPILLDGRVNADVLETMMWGGFGFGFATAVVSAVEAIVMQVRAGQNIFEVMALQRRIMLFMKLGLIPFFLYGGLLIAAMVLIAVIPGVILISMVAVPVMVALGWLVMMSGSVWVICYVANLRRFYIISAGRMTFHIVMQCCFVLDVIDAIALFSQGKPWVSQMGIPLSQIYPRYPIR